MDGKRKCTSRLIKMIKNIKLSRNTQKMMRRVTELKKDEDKEKDDG